jgi:hypothetical protein
MLKRNAIYTAKEIIEECGADPKLIGKVRVVIAGISGIVSPDHLVSLPFKMADKLEVIVATEAFTLDLDGPVVNAEMSEGAKVVVQAKAEEESKE